MPQEPYWPKKAKQVFSVYISGLYSSIIKPKKPNTQIGMKREPLTVKIAYTSVFTALGIILAHTFFFRIFGTLAFPGQHLVNAVAGVILGPWWASLVAILVGTYRNAVGIGTLFAYPGGIPGAVVVGVAYRLLRRRYGVRASLAAALLEPVGTVLIGATISLLAIAPVVSPETAELITRLGIAGALAQFYTGWALSSVPGAVIGYLLLIALHKFQAITLAGETGDDKPR